MDFYAHGTIFYGKDTFEQIHADLEEIVMHFDKGEIEDVGGCYTWAASHDEVIDVDTQIADLMKKHNVQGYLYIRQGDNDMRRTFEPKPNTVTLPRDTAAGIHVMLAIYAEKVWDWEGHRKQVVEAMEALTKALEEK